MHEDTKGAHTLTGAALFAADRYRESESAIRLIHHCIAVTHTLTRHGVTDSTVLTSALLHHLVSSTSTSRAELIGTFGPDVTKVVLEVTYGPDWESGDRSQLDTEAARRLSDRAKLVTIAHHACTAAEMRDLPSKNLDYLDWADEVVNGCRGVNEYLDEFYDGMVREAREATRTSIADPQPEARWELWAEDVLDGESNPLKSDEGGGLAYGLEKLWESYLSEEVDGLLRFTLKWSTADIDPPGIRVRGSQDGARRLRSWVFGTEGAVAWEHIQERDVQLLRLLGRAHARLAPAEGAGELILSAAEAAADSEAFRQRLPELGDSR